MVEGAYFTCYFACPGGHSRVFCLSKFIEGGSKMQTKKTRNLVMISLLAAMSFVLMYVVQIPLLPAAPFLKWDPSDLPNVLGGLVLGPGAAFLIALIKCLLFLLLKGSEGPMGA